MVSAPVGAGGGIFRAIHHIGVSVLEIERSVGFWERLLGRPARWRRLLDGAYLGEVTGYPGIRLEAAVVDLPGGAALELLQYLVDGRRPHDPATAHPGNVHVCLMVDDLDAAWRHALEAGATPVSPRPVDITAGPNAAARSCYLRDPDGVTIELFQAPPTAGADPAAGLAPS